MRAFVILPLWVRNYPFLNMCYRSLLVDPLSQAQGGREVSLG